MCICNTHGQNCWPVSCKGSECVLNGRTLYWITVGAEFVVSTPSNLCSRVLEKKLIVA
jgi:hypothetical protein